jgi:hypothetical protein
VTRAPLHTRRPFLAGVVRQWPLGLVLLAVAAGMVLVAVEYWRRGLIVMGLAVVGAGLLRLVLPVRRAGFLAVRSRVIDLVLYLGTGLTLTVIAVLIPPG